MPNNKNTHGTFLELVAPWIRGYQIAVYVTGREKPLTGLTVCSVQPGVLLARWNSSTHLIPLEAIAYIRFAPDCDPCRDPAHPLHDLVAMHRPGDLRGQAPSKISTSRKFNRNGHRTEPEVMPQPYVIPNLNTVLPISDIIKNMRLPKRTPEPDETPAPPHEDRSGDANSNR